MKVIDATVRVQHECSMCNLSRSYPDARMAVWCNGSTDCLQVMTDKSGDLESILDAVQGRSITEEILRERFSAMTIIRECACDGEYIPGIIQKAGCWSIGPSTYEGGYEVHRLVAPSKNRLRECVSMLRLIGKVEISSMRSRETDETLKDLGILPVPVLEGLTEKQIEVLVSAHENGIFSIPAKMKMDDVAKKLGMSRSTYGEHLRKAMNTVMDNSYPMLKLFAVPRTK
ncbi:MAG: HTH DNA binding domain protein [Methanomassiliicoccales archaeon PtaU1.Bin124]|nr:MAG: HTH DNA binding domain protein [Methanomassiliicoccales archaeon PtaU1.Bin124]